MVHESKERRALTARYDKRMLDDMPIPPKHTGAYAKEMGGPIEHFVFIGDEPFKPGLLSKFSEALKKETDYGIHPSSISFLEGGSFYDGISKMAIQESLYQYSNIPGAFGVITRSAGWPISIMYYRYDSLLPPEHLRYLFLLANNDSVRPDMVFLLEDRLVDFFANTDLIEEETMYPSEESDIELFRKGFIKDYLHKHQIPFKDLSN